MLLMRCQKKAVLITLLLIFLLYFFTLPLSIQPNGDSGELVSTAYFGGIAHPPGYPLYNLIGHLFLKLPIPGEPAYRLNLLSALFAIIALWFFYKICLLLSNKDYFVSTITTVILGISYSFWQYAIVAEVFSLLSLFYCVIIYLLIRILYNRDKKSIIRLSLMTSFVFGLALTNNHLIITLLPAFAYVFIRQNRRFQIYENIKQKILASGLLLLTLVLGLTPYLYMLWSSQNINPASWTYPTNLNDVIRHFLRLDYGRLGAFHDFSLQKVALKTAGFNILIFLISLPNEFSSFAYIFPFVLFYLLINYRKKIARLILIIWSGNLFLLLVLKFEIWGFTLAIMDRLFIPINIAMSLAMVPFVHYVFGKITNHKYLFLATFSFAFLAFFLFLASWQTNRLWKNNNSCQLLYQDMMRTTPAKSVVLLTGDIQIFCFFYEHYVLRNYKQHPQKYFLVSYYLQPKNNGKYLRLAQNFSIPKKTDPAYLFEKYGKNFTVLIDSYDNLKTSSMPLGVFKKAIPQNQTKTKDFYRTVFAVNEKWFKNSVFLSTYHEAQVGLAANNVKEIYCVNYLSAVDFFVKKKELEWATKTFQKVQQFCEENDFSARNAYTRFKIYQAKLRSD